MNDSDSEIASAIDDLRESLSSPNVRDSNLEMANVTDTIQHVANALRSISRAITADKTSGEDAATGGDVDSLTEAVMGITAGLYNVASAISKLASAVRDNQSHSS